MGSKYKYKNGSNLGSSTINVDHLVSDMLANEMARKANKLSKVDKAKNDSTTNLSANKLCQEQFDMVNGFIETYSEKITKDIKSFKKIKELFYLLDTRIKDKLNEIRGF